MTDYRKYASQIANRYNIPQNLFARMIGAESAWNQSAVSPVGAQGFAQLMPATARELGVDPTDPMQNIEGGGRYLRQQYDEFGDWSLALAAYNAGAGAVKKYGRQIPPYKETQNYVAKIMGGSPIGGVAGNTTRTGGTGNDNLGGSRMDGQQKLGGLLGLPPENQGTSLAGRFANAFNELRQQPSQMIPQMVEQRTQRRQRNRTADWLAQQPNGEQWAQAIRNGSDAGQVIQAYKKEMAPPPAAKMPTNVAELEYLMANGMSREDAIKMAFATGGNITNAAQVPAPPAGWENVFDTEGRLVSQRPIEGGPAARKIADEEAAEAARNETMGDIKTKTESTVSKSTDYLINALSDGRTFAAPVAGVGGNFLADLGVNQAAVDFRNELVSLQAVVAFGRLQEMRDASKSGGALGGVSEKELNFLVSAYGNLMQSTSPERLKENLITIRDIMLKIENDPIAYRAYTGTGEIDLGDTLSGGGGVDNGGSIDGFTVMGVVGK